MKKLAKRDNASYYYDQTNYGRTYYDGNAVRKTELPSYNPNVRIKTSVKPKKTLKKEQLAKQQKQQAKAKVKSLLSVALLIVAAFFVLYRGVVITETTNAIEKKEKQLSDIVATNERVKMEIEHALDLKTVESAAVDRLGMNRPEKYQTVYVDLNQVDHVEKISKGNIGEESKLFAFFGKAKEYLD